MKVAGVESSIRRRKNATVKEKSQGPVRGRKSAAPIRKRARCLDILRSPGTKETQLTKGPRAVSADATVHKNKMMAEAADVRESCMVITRSGKRVAEDSSDESQEEKSSQHGGGGKAS